MILPLFAYGTLQPGEAAFDELGLAALVEPLGPATVAGTLYDLGDYPGALPGGDGTIYGELLLPRDEALLATLDAYELYDPGDLAGSEYRRIQTVTKSSGVAIWIYAYNFPVKSARLVPGGDWRRRALP